MNITKAALQRIVQEELEANNKTETEQIEETELLNENPAITAVLTQALSNPEIQKMILDALLPVLTQALSGATGGTAVGGPAGATTTPDVTPAV